MTATAFVLAAGLGTRLRPLTEHHPKPLVPVCGVPLLSYALAHLAQHGHREAVVNAFWLAEQVEAWEGVHEGVRVRVSTEGPEVLGTGGGLKKARPWLGEQVAVLNGDILTDIDLTALAAATPPGGAAMALRPNPEGRYGTVNADVTGEVVHLIDQARIAPQGPLAGETHFTGVHCLDRDVLDRVPDGFACIVRTAYKTLVPEHLLRATHHAGLWLDLGTPADYLAANLAVLGGLPLALDPFTHTDDPRRDCWVGNEAAVTGTLTRSIVGHRAVVPEGASLTRCVVWDDCVVPPGEHVDTVFFPGGALPVR